MLKKQTKTSKTGSTNKTYNAFWAFCKWKEGFGIFNKGGKMNDSSTKMYLIKLHMNLQFEWFEQMFRVTHQKKEYQLLSFYAPSS